MYFHDALTESSASYGRSVLTKAQKCVKVTFQPSSIYSSVSCEGSGWTIRTNVSIRPSAYNLIKDGDITTIYTAKSICNISKVTSLKIHFL